jgi:hypothetical protein
MAEEKSVIAEFTRVEGAAELEISDLYELAVACFRLCPAIDLVDSRVFRYASELLVPPDPTIFSIFFFLVLFLV